MQVSPHQGSDGPARGEALLGIQRTKRGHVVDRLRRGDRLAPRILGADGGAVHACLLPTQAGPLSGDHDRVRIEVGANATLVVSTITATLALPGSALTRLELDVDVGHYARLVLEDPPLIVAAGADVERSTQMTLAAGAVAALRDTIVLGRAGEPGGRLVSTLRATDDAGVVLHDELSLDPATYRQDAHVALAPGHRVAGSLYLLGLEAQGEPQFALARAGGLRRATAEELSELEAELAGPWAHWARAAAPGADFRLSSLAVGPSSRAVRPLPGYPVTAPSEALDTSRAYFASTPVSRVWGGGT